MGKADLQLFGGDWTEQKLDALSQYLIAYTRALSKTKFKRVYLDAFAGTGYREQKVSAETQREAIFAEEIGPLADSDPQRFFDGSPRISLKDRPPFHQFIFVESSREKAAELTKLKSEFPTYASAIDIRFGNANRVIQDICKSWDKKGTRGVLFVDPFGMQAEWETIQAVAATGCIDTWILFPFAANRLMTRYANDIPPTWRNRLNALFGTNEWEQRFYKKRSLVDLFQGDEQVVEKNLTLRGLGSYYQERLGTVFPVVAPNPRVLRTKTHRPLFQLFFAASNPGRGGEIAVDIAEYILDHM